MPRASKARRARHVSIGRDRRHVMLRMAGASEHEQFCMTTVQNASKHQQSSPAVMMCGLHSPAVPTQLVQHNMLASLDECITAESGHTQHPISSYMMDVRVFLLVSCRTSALYCSCKVCCVRSCCHTSIVTKSLTIMTELPYSLTAAFRRGLSCSMLASERARRSQHHVPDSLLPTMGTADAFCHLLRHLTRCDRLASLPGVQARVQGLCLCTNVPFCRFHRKKVTLCTATATWHPPGTERIRSVGVPTSRTTVCSRQHNTVCSRPPWSRYSERAERVTPRRLEALA